MTFHPFHIVLIICVAVAIWRSAGALRTGEVRDRKVRYRRADQPAEYWFTILSEAGLVLALLWFANQIAREEQSPASLLWPLLLLAAVATIFWMIRGFQLGTASFGSLRAERSESPTAFWGLLLVPFAITVALALLAVSWKFAPAAEELPDIYLVTEAVRRHIPQDRVAAFGNVRTDAASGFVCGEFTMKEDRRRFFGRVSEGRLLAIVEHPGSTDFAQRYRRLCAGKWLVPSQG